MERIFLDTDIGFDCDDVGGIAILCALYKKKAIELLGINHSCSLNHHGCEIIDAVTSFYGVNDVKIGYCDSDESIFKNLHVHPYNEAVLEKWKPNGKRTYRPSTDLIIDTLLSSEDKSVTYVCIGMLTNLAKAYRYVDSSKGISGKELLDKKIKEIVIMGGDFSKNISEFNILCDVSSAKYLVENAATKMSFLDFKTGEAIKTGGALIKKYDEGNPVVLSYKIFASGDRESWDPLTVTYASKEKKEIFTLSNPGTVKIDEEGITSFEENAEGRHYLIKLGKENNEVINLINSLMEGKI